MTSNSVYAVMGGTFDPVHHGHLRAALEARNKLGLERLNLIPAGNPPHRGETFASADHRRAMLELATHSCPGLGIDDREVRREGPSFMVDTLREIRGENMDSPVLLLIGRDAAQSLPAWHRWTELFSLAHIVVLQRPGTGSQLEGMHREIRERWTIDPDSLHQSPAGAVFPLAVTQLDISSTGIRELLQHDASPRYLLPTAVLEYIRENSLYLAT